MAKDTVRERGNGRVFLRDRTYWIAYYLRGVEYRESAQTGDEKKAGTFLKSRMQEVGADKRGWRTFVTPKANRLTVHDLVEALKANFELRGKASSQNLSYFKKVDEDFGRARAVDLTSEAIDAFITQKLAEGVAKASVNRTTQLLGQSFRLAVKRGHLSRVPSITRLDESDNVRQGFFSEQEFRTLLTHLPAELRDFASFGFATGMRSGEIKSLTWDMIQGDDLQIPGNITKNRNPRIVPLECELAEIIERRQAARKVEINGVAEMARFIFHRLVHGRIVPVGDFKKSWSSACVAAGLGRFVCRKCKETVSSRRCEQCKTEAVSYVGKIFHDFRRSAVRAMVKAGVNQQLAKRLSGHESDSMFSRYAIFETDDLREAQKKHSEYRKTEQQKVVSMAR